MAQSVPSTVYWMLPGPRALVDSVAGKLTAYRAVVLHLLAHAAIAPERALQLAIEGSRYENEAVVRVPVTEASHLPSSVGLKLHRDTLPAATLAGLRQDHRCLLVLAPQDGPGRMKCADYLQEFADETRRVNGNVHLVVERIDREPSWAEQPNVHTVFFNGALTEEELQAYVGMRMVGRRWPGSTQLSQCLVSEFAGFDASFAEELMRLDKHELLLLPESLSAAAHAFPVPAATWRDKQAPGASATFDEFTRSHVLYEWHAASLPGAERLEYQRRLDRRYWRACLRALMPWLEERRMPVLDVLRPALRDLLRPLGGESALPSLLKFRGGQPPNRIDDLEFNDIASLARGHVGGPRLRWTTERDKAAINICFDVSKVRNEIAHMRPPPMDKVSNLVAALDGLLGRSLPA